MRATKLFLLRMKIEVWSMHVEWNGAESVSNGLIEQKIKSLPVMSSSLFGPRFKNIAWHPRSGKNLIAAEHFW